MRRAAVALCCLGLASCASMGRRLTMGYEAVIARLSPNEVVIDLNRSFIEAYKNKVTIDVTFTVDAAAARPNPKIFDGDLHFAGRAPEIGLRVVGEIINADKQDSAVALVHAARSSKVPLRLTGAWRLWPEHALGSRQEQGRPVEPLRNANPEHVFEVHPVIRIGGLSLLESFVPVDGYLPGDAKRSFEIYETAEASLQVMPDRITLTSASGLYNDVRFVMRLANERQQVVSDGRFVTASVLDLEGNLLVDRVRMVFVKGTAPERAVRGLRPGASIVAWGKPRVSFLELSRRIRDAARNPQGLTATLPYEILVLGVYPDSSRR